MLKYYIGELNSVCLVYKSFKVRENVFGFIKLDLEGNDVDKFILDQNKKYATVFYEEETNECIVRNLFKNSLDEKNSYYIDDSSSNMRIKDTLKIIPAFIEKVGKNFYDHYLIEYTINNLMLDGGLADIEIARRVLDEYKEKLVNLKLESNPDSGLVENTSYVNIFLRNLSYENKKNSINNK
uniref:Uncharacterized protein n=1 Tax=viral metagenome TaxID=1070528 RepID=A0A6C0BD71_9ZZZZ